MRLSLPRQARHAVLGLGAVVVVALSGVPLLPAQAAAQGPCDLYAAGGTPCVAAHSTTRALYGSYSGALYQVRRASDNATRDVAPVEAGGIANAATQNSFCSGSSCVISVVYDQSGRGNHLTPAPGGDFTGPASGGYDNPANAIAAPVTVGGRPAWGIFVTPGTGYRDNSTNGIATGDRPEGMYAIFDGTHYNSGCCFDYGNAETNSRNNGNGTMEALYFGNSTSWGSGSGNGPWIMADLENGLFSGVNPRYNAGDPSISHRFLTATLKGEPNHWSIRGGNAQSGGLSTFYDGVRPNANGYNPMKKEGAIILGIGGDNSISAAGTFYEGAMTSGYPSAATENAVQANIVAAGYATRTVAGPFTSGARISLQATTGCCATQYIRHATNSTEVRIAQITASSSAADKADATWVVRPGLADTSCVSFESANSSGKYLRHYDYHLRLEAKSNDSAFGKDATFCPTAGNSGQGYSLRSSNYPTRYLRHYDHAVHIASNGGSNTWDASAHWADDTSWLVVGPWS